MRQIQMIIVLAALALASCDREAAQPALPPQAADSAEAGPEAARAVVQEIYARYGQETAGTAAAAPYSARLTALLAENERLTPAGDQGFLDADPFCGCQDWSGFTLDSVTIIPTGQDRVDASVTITNMGRQDRRVLAMVREDGGWRVDDVISIEHGSVFAGLAEANGALAATG